MKPAVATLALFAVLANARVAQLHPRYYGYEVAETTEAAEEPVETAVKVEEAELEEEEVVVEEVVSTAVSDAETPVETEVEGAEVKIPASPEVTKAEEADALTSGAEVDLPSETATTEESIETTTATGEEEAATEEPTGTTEVETALAITDPAETPDATPSPIITLIEEEATATGYTSATATESASETEVETADPADITTVVVQTTETQTITSCAPTVTACPTKAEDIAKLPESELETKVVTNTVVFTKVVCPVSEVESVSQSVASKVKGGEITGSTLTVDPSVETGDVVSPVEDDVSTTITATSTTTATKIVTLPFPGETNGATPGNAYQEGNGSTTGNDGVFPGAENDGCECPAPVTVTVTADAAPASTVYVTVAAIPTAPTKGVDTSSPVTAEQPAEEESYDMEDEEEYDGEEEEDFSDEEVDAEDAEEEEDCQGDYTVTLKKTVTAEATATATATEDVVAATATADAEAEAEETAYETAYATATETAEEAAETTGTVDAEDAEETAQTTEAPSATATTAAEADGPSTVYVDEEIIVTPIPKEQVYDY